MMEIILFMLTALGGLVALLMGLFLLCVLAAWIGEVFCPVDLDDEDGPA